jgi:hypothetical protein
VDTYVLMFIVLKGRQERNGREDWRRMYFEEDV